MQSVGSIYNAYCTTTAPSSASTETAATDAAEAAEAAAAAEANTRYIDKGNGTIYDSVSNLTWLKDANCFGPRSQSQAVASSSSLVSGQCGLTDGSKAGDWHLPSISELRTFVDAGFKYYTLNAVGFSNVQAKYYWSSTLQPDTWAGVSIVNMNDGRVYGDYTGYSNYFLPVRTGHVLNAHPVANAGTAQSVSTGTVLTLDGSASSDTDDELLTYHWNFTSKPYGSSATLSSSTVVKPTFTTDLTGLYVLSLVVNDGKVDSMPASVNINAKQAVNFIDKGNGTIYESISNLIWLKDANCFGTQNWDSAFASSNALASGTCGLTDGSNVGDWRLPTIEEFKIIGDAGYNASSLNAAGFSNVKPSYYWSTSTYAGIFGHAYVATIESGGWATYSMSNPFYVWPVRNGQ